MIKRVWNKETYGPVCHPRPFHFKMRLRRAWLDCYYEKESQSVHFIELIGNTYYVYEKLY